MGLLFIPQVIYEHVEPWWNINGKTPDSSIRALWQSSSSKAGGTVKGNNEFGLMKYLCILKGSLTCRKILLPLGRRAVEFYHPQSGLNL
jgi:hypothetical protein